MKEKAEKIRQILSENIKKRRECLGLSQEKLAEMADLSVQTINTIEGCRMWVSDKSITRLARALEQEVFQLFIPCQSAKTSPPDKPYAVILDLREKVKKDIQNLDRQIEKEFLEAIKKVP